MAFSPGASASRVDLGLECGGVLSLLPMRLPSLRRLGRPRGGAARRAAMPRVGMDLISVAKVRRVFAGTPALLEQVFTRDERDYAEGQRRPFEHLAARFAA